MVSRDPGHFLILLEQILQKTQEVRVNQMLISTTTIDTVESGLRSALRLPGHPEGLPNAGSLPALLLLCVLSCVNV